MPPACQRGQPQLGNPHKISLNAHHHHPRRSPSSHRPRSRLPHHLAPPPYRRHRRFHASRPRHPRPPLRHPLRLTLRPPRLHPLPRHRRHPRPHRNGPQRHVANLPLASLRLHLPIRRLPRPARHPHHRRPRRCPPLALRQHPLLRPIPRHPGLTHRRRPLPQPQRTPHHRHRTPLGVASDDVASSLALSHSEKRLRLSLTP